MSEKVLRRWVVDALRPLHAFAVENPVNPGTPDVECTLCWIELKHVEEAPVRVDTVLAVPHYTPQQRFWARQRNIAGGCSFMLIQVSSEFLLFRGEDAAHYVGYYPLQFLRERALVLWKTKPSPSQFLNSIISLHRSWNREVLFSRLVRSSSSSVEDKTGH